MILNRETEEKRQHSTSWIPYSFYEVRIPEALNNVPMHWHSEFELNRVLRGTGEFICGDNHFIAKEGDLILFPPNVLQYLYMHMQCLKQSLKQKFHLLYFFSPFPNPLAIKTFKNSSTTIMY